MGCYCMFEGQGNIREKTVKKNVVVDLETGILYRGVFWEGLWCWVRWNPFKAIGLPFYWVRGTLPSEITQVLNSTKIFPPVRGEVIDVLQNLKNQGSEITLIHKGMPGLAAGMQARMGLFDKVSTRLPDTDFTYVTTRGDAQHWQKASAGIVFGDKLGTEQSFDIPVETKGEDSVSSIKLLMKAMRVHQWAKSLLVFAPIILSQRVMETNLWLSCVAAFLCFGLVSSSTYIMNDMLDLEADRQHPTKRRRPFASGHMPLYWGGFLYFALLSVGLWVGFLVAPEVSLALAGYAIFNLAYTFKLKSIPVMDTFILTSMYIWRLAVGSLAVSISLSVWVYMYCVFFFFSLAQVKRVTELIQLSESGDDPRQTGRGYSMSDLPMLRGFGIAASFLSSGIFALYIDAVGRGQDLSIWGINILCLYWLCRIWLLTTRGEMASDPVKFALKDPASLLIGSLVLVLWFV